MAIHTFDQAHLLAGAAPAWVNCHELSLAGSWLAGSATAVATVTFRNGSVLDYRGSIAAWGCTTSWNGSWRVEGDGLSATWNGIGAAVATTRPFDEVGRPSGDTRVSVDLEVAERGDGHALCLAEMLSALKAGVPSPTDAEEVIYGVAMVDAARTSASENRRVDVSGMDLP
jgi:predicted dehydrogenase